MIELKNEYPYNGKDNLIKHYAQDNEGNYYYIIQNETGIKYSSAIDVYPCRYTYSTTTEIIKNKYAENITENK